MTRAFKPYLPGVLALIAEEVSEDVAVRLAEARGGREVYIPKSATPECELSQILGREHASALVSLLGYGTLLVPCGNIGGAAGRRAKILQLREQGLTYSQIAAEVDVHVRTVERTTARLRDDREPELPF